MKLHRWMHKDVFDAETVWFELTLSGNLKDAEQQYLKQSRETKIPKTDLVKIRHDTVEKQMSDRQKLLDIAIKENDKSSIDLWSKMLKQTTQDVWWWRGIRYKNRSILDKIRRYFYLCCHYKNHNNNSQANWLSKNWWLICLYFDEKKIHFRSKVDFKS
tara:strand:+ start:134 stop:610 length:477 start_codon:yes stop_codon:yes gene_type:complete